MTLKEKIQQFTEDFNQMEGWDAKFDYIILLSNEITDVPGELFLPVNRIEGCISRTYFMCKYVNGRACIEGYSNAAIPAGITAIMKQIFEGYTREEIREVLHTPELRFWETTGLLNHLTPARYGAVLQMKDRLS